MARRHLPVAAVLSLVLVPVVLATADRGRDRDEPRPNRAPRVESTLEPTRLVRAGEVLRFTVVVRDPDGDRASLRLLNAPPGLIFHPVIARATPFAAEVRWVVPAGVSAVPELVFRATDHPRDRAVPRSTDFMEHLLDRPGRPAGTRVSTGDVTGDGIPDVVGAATLADVSGVVNAGALYVWAGGATISGAPGPPTATLTVPGATAGDQLAAGPQQGVHLVDVTGDGILDVVAVAFQADVLGDANAGAVYVFEGGPVLSGTTAPSATLTVLGGQPGDRLGETGIVFEDLDGDGLVDLLVGAHRADVLGVLDAGAVYFFRGGPGLTGGAGANADAVLHVPTATAGDQLGRASGLGIQAADVTGDGLDDLVVGASFADVGGNVNAGAVYVWEGGGALSGFVPPSVRLVADPGDLHPGDLVGTSSGQGIQLADVTGDGVLDVVAGVESYDQPGLADLGAVFVWEGGINLTTIPNPIAVLRDALSGSTGERAGRASGQGVQLADVSGDGILDVVVAAPLADEFGPILDVGRVHVWRGGTTLLGDLDPDLSLVTFGQAGDRIGEGAGQAVLLADLNGDARLDVVVAAPLFDGGSARDLGEVYVWNGQNLAFGAGPLTPDANFGGGLQPGDRVGSATGQGLQLADLDGDLQLDLVIGASQADFSATDEGRIFAWQGGAAFFLGSTTVTDLSVPGAASGDRMGDAEGQGIQLGDVDGDGIADVVAGAMQADSFGIVDTGAIYVWSSLASFGSFPSGAPTSTLQVPTANPGDRLGDASGQGIRLGDVTGDGVADVVAGSQRADRNALDSGALYVWNGGGSIGFSPDATLEVSLPDGGDRLGYASQGFQLADLTGDGVLDVLAAAQEADVGGVVNTGAAYLWAGAPYAGGIAVGEDALLTVPGAAAGDQLGR